MYLDSQELPCFTLEAHRNVQPAEDGCQARQRPDGSRSKAFCRTFCWKAPIIESLPKNLTVKSNLVTESASLQACSHASCLAARYARSRTLGQVSVVRLKANFWQGAVPLEMDLAGPRRSAAPASFFKPQATVPRVAGPPYRQQLEAFQLFVQALSLLLAPEYRRYGQRSWAWRCCSTLAGL